MFLEVRDNCLKVLSFNFALTQLKINKQGFLVQEVGILPQLNLNSKGMKIFSCSHFHTITSLAKNRKYKSCFNYLSLFLFTRYHTNHVCDFAYRRYKNGIVMDKCSSDLRQRISFIGKEKTRSELIMVWLKGFCLFLGPIFVTLHCGCQ